MVFGRGEAGLFFEIFVKGTSIGKQAFDSKRINGMSVQVARLDQFHGVLYFQDILILPESTIGVIFENVLQVTLRIVYFEGKLL